MLKSTIKYKFLKMINQHPMFKTPKKDRKKRYYNNSNRLSNHLTLSPKSTIKIITLRK